MLPDPRYAEPTRIWDDRERAGSVIFFDAIPLEVPKFQLDIMNPHYPNYYAREQGQNRLPIGNRPTLSFS
jgi:CRISPR type III-B/RAMP module RAMP protein Cmr6